MRVAQANDLSLYNRFFIAAAAFAEYTLFSPRARDIVIRIQKIVEPLLIVLMLEWIAAHSLHLQQENDFFELCQAYFNVIHQQTGVVFDVSICASTLEHLDEPLKKCIQLFCNKA